MNWYGKIICAQVWEVDSDESFTEDLKAFYELEYKYNAIKNFPFEGMPQRYDNIFKNIEDSLMYVMDRLRGTLMSTFSGWLESHAITDPATWAQRRVDPYGDGFMGSYDANDTLEGIISEYIRYKNGGQYPNPMFSGPNTDQVFSEMLNDAMANSENFTSLGRVSEEIQMMERERLENDLYNDEFENFGENERGNAFQSEEEAQMFIEEQVENIDIGDYIYGYGKELLLSILEGSGQMEQFLIELNQYAVFPLWYTYWGSMGIDTTRELAEEAYDNLSNAKGFQEFHESLEEAIQTCHQNGSMLDYLSEYGGEEYGGDPEEIEAIMFGLTEGKTNFEWDKELKSVGVKVPMIVREHNLEQAKV